ncbi:MAG: type II toxin-antitoxin system HicA family toxin [Chlorobiota bacterium]|nr:MAG: type II toxin-antitoxin system HicA family toxin [Chlorobiota bacterium]
MKIPRDLTAGQLIRGLRELGYEITRQKGSHIRLTKVLNDGDHHITIPNHSPIKIGTLNSIITDVSSRLKILKEDLITYLK